MIAYRHYKILFIFYFVLLSPSGKAGVYAFSETCSAGSNNVCYGLSIAGLTIGGFSIIALLYKLNMRCRGSNRINIMNIPRNINGINNANLRRIDRSGDPAYNARRMAQNHTPLEIGQPEHPPFQPTQLSELAEFDKLYLRESHQGTDQTKRQWNELASASSSSTPINTSTRREHTAVRMNELYEESRSSDVTVPPPPYTAKP